MNTVEAIVLSVCILSIIIAALLTIGLLAESAKARKEAKNDAPPRQSWWARKTPMEQKSINNAILVSFLIVSVIGLLVAAMLGSGSGTSSSGRHLSESAKREAFYNIVKTQDQNPDSNAWNEGVKEAAAKSYGVPMSEINSLIREGATNRWLTPPPP